MADKEVLLADPKTGQVFSVAPDEAKAAATSNGLVPASEEVKTKYLLSLAPGGEAVAKLATGTVGALRSGAEAAAATVNEFTNKNPIAKFADKHLGTHTADVVPELKGKDIIPPAYSPGMDMLVKTYPGYYTGGVVAADTAAMLLTAGGSAEAKAASKLGRIAEAAPGFLSRAGVAGMIAEGGETGQIGDEFSIKDAMFYGLTAETLGSLTNAGIGRLMRATDSAAPEALEVAAHKAFRSDVADAVGELPNSPLKAQKLAANAPALTAKATTEFAESVANIEQRLTKAEAKMFSESSVSRAVSSNTEAQKNIITSTAANMDSLAAELAASGEQSAFSDTLRKGAASLEKAKTGAQMYSATRKLAQAIESSSDTASSPFAQKILSNLEDVLSDEPTWGKVAKQYTEHKATTPVRQAFSDGIYNGVKINEARMADVFNPQADRSALNAYLDTADAAARASGDKALRTSVAAARSALASGDDAVAASMVTSTFGDKAREKATDFITNTLVGKGTKTLLGAAGMSGGPGGAAAGYMAGQLIEPKLTQFARPYVAKAVDAAAPFVEDALSGNAVSSVQATRGILQKLAQSARTQVETAGRSLSNPELRSAMSTLKNITAPTMSVGVSRFMGQHESLRDAFSEKKEILSKISSDPASLVDEMSSSYGTLPQDAPRLYASIVAKNYQALSFIKSKMPATIGASLASPSGVPPSQLAVRQFALYYSAATDPSSVVEDVKNNRVRAEQMEALRTVWPEVYTDLKQSVLEGMQSSKPTPSQRQRMDLLFDFGTALDAGLSWSLALKADEARQEKARSSPPRRGSSRKSVQRTTQAMLPQGLASLQNPQGFS